MTAAIEGGFELHSEERGGHWVAWVTAPGQNTPYRSVLFVGETREEAEERARERANQSRPAQTGSAASS
jgi:hypothetical protein